jgi:hypothetical protein
MISCGEALHEWDLVSYLLRGKIGDEGLRLAEVDHYQPQCFFFGTRRGWGEGPLVDCNLSNKFQSYFANLAQSSM